MEKSVLIPIAEGIEEIEAVTLIDVLRRAGAQVTVAAVDTLQITASRGVKLVADQRLAQCREEIFDLIALPGGVPGAEHLGESPELQEMLKKQNERSGLIGAICAAPALVLAAQGLLAGRQATCHPAFSHLLPVKEKIETRVVVDGHIITSRGPGSAMEFALKLVELLYGLAKAAEVAGPMLVD